MTVKEFFESTKQLAIHCDTIEKAEKLIQKFDQLGYRWADSSRYTNFEKRSAYNRRICFDNKNCCGFIDWYKKCNYKILEFEDIDDFKEFNMNHMIKIGEFSEKLENISKAVEDLKKGFEALKEKIKESNVGFEDDPIFLLSKEEYERYKPKIPQLSCGWWLRSPGDDSDNGVGVYSDGSVCVYGDYIGDSVAVRPVIKMREIRDCLYNGSTYCGAKNGRFLALGATWKVIDEEKGLAIAEMPIMFSYFDEKSNDYEKSDVRKSLLYWYKERIEW